MLEQAQLKMNSPQFEFCIITLFTAQSETMGPHGYGAHGSDRTGAEAATHAVHASWPTSVPKTYCCVPVNKTVAKVVSTPKKIDANTIEEYILATKLGSAHQAGRMRAHCGGATLTIAGAEYIGKSGSAEYVDIILLGIGGIVMESVLSRTVGGFASTDRDMSKEQAVGCFSGGSVTLRRHNAHVREDLSQFPKHSSWKACPQSVVLI